MPAFEPQEDILIVIVTQIRQNIIKCNIKLKFIVIRDICISLSVPDIYISQGIDAFEVWWGI